MSQYFFQIFITGPGLGVIIFGTIIFIFGIPFSILALKLKNIASGLLNFIKIRISNVMLSLLFLIILLLPTKHMFDLLGLSMFFPIISGIYACIFASVSLCIKNKSHLLNYINYMCIFTYTALGAYTIYIIKDSNLLEYFFPLLLLAETGFYTEPVNVLSKTALCMEDSDVNPLSFSPILGNRSSQTPSPPPSFEDLLWINRSRSSGDAKALDFAKRILLMKICHKYNVPADLQMEIQDNI